MHSQGRAKIDQKGRMAKVLSGREARPWQLRRSKATGRIIQIMYPALGD